ncbi:CoA transferase subunit A [Amycolatopsis viridis]|uniref:Glutaconate CoA-transferase subunit A n=1 Tax=Amycolatopsis viridis TaxID=185678 RepID=A0ABX0SZR0_9PSEU|nr:CoA transferase subunit A [Amycolatopsis viridis]NIH80810.1 glutaconate CoA-transferase subunit A [Amycolatopsis viridis]
MTDKQMSAREVVGRLRSGMTIGIGGWAARRKPMALVREILRSDLTDLTIVSYGGPDVGLLCAAGKVRKLVFGFVTLDSVPLDPHFRAARQRGEIEVAEYDEGMLQWGLYAAGLRLPFLPTRAGLGSSVWSGNPGLRTVADPYGSGDELIAMPAIPLDAALVHMNRADVHGNAQFLGPDPYFDDLFCLAAEQAFVSCERIVPTAELTAQAHPATLVLKRLVVDGVVEAPGGAHFTSCVPDYDVDTQALHDYAASAASPEAWAEFRREYLSGGAEHARDAEARTA